MGNLAGPFADSTSADPTLYPRRVTGGKPEGSRYWVSNTAAVSRSLGVGGK